MSTRGKRALAIVAGLATGIAFVLALFLVDPTGIRSGKEIVHAVGKLDAHAARAWLSRTRLVIIGGVVLLGVLARVALGRDSELVHMLAVRYLTLDKRRSYRLHVVTHVVAWAGILVAAASNELNRHAPDWLFMHPGVREALRWNLIVAPLALFVALFLVELVRRLTIFSAISTFGLFLGTSALVIVLSVMSGFAKDLEHKILGANAHIVVTAPDKQLLDWRDLEKKLRTVADVTGVSPFISAEVMISSQSNLSGVLLKGIDAATVGTVTDLRKNIEQGSLDYLDHPEKIEVAQYEQLPAAPGEKSKIVEIKPSPEEPKPEKRLEKKAAPPKEGDEDPFVVEMRARKRVMPAVVVGRELAKNLRTYLGDDVNLISPIGDVGPSGDLPRSRPFRVGGIFFSGMYEYDSKYVYISIAAAQRFLGLDDEVTGFELKVRDAAETRRPADDIKAMLGPGFEVQTWQESNRHLFSALKIEQVAMFIVLCFVILVASFSIVANGIMLVREKGSEIAILKSMGIRDSAVLRAFFYTGAFMGGVGTLVGVGVGLATSFALRNVGIEFQSDVFYISRLPVEISAPAVAAIVAAAFGLAFVAIVYPALVAARLRPVEGLRYDHG